MGSVRARVPRGYWICCGEQGCSVSAVVWTSRPASSLPRVVWMMLASRQPAICARPLTTTLTSIDAINEDDTANNGTAVSALVAGLVVSDADGDPIGMSQRLLQRMTELWRVVELCDAAGAFAAGLGLPGLVHMDIDQAPLLVVRLPKRGER